MGSPRTEADAQTPAYVERLYAAPLERFTAVRKELASELRAKGDKEGATALAAMRKPSRSAWALGEVARRHPAEMRALLRATDEARDAQDARREETRRRGDAGSGAVMDGGDREGGRPRDEAPRSERRRSDGGGAPGHGADAARRPIRRGRGDRSADARDAGDGPRTAESDFGVFGGVASAPAPPEVRAEAPERRPEGRRDARAEAAASKEAEEKARRAAAAATAEAERAREAARLAKAADEAEREASRLRGRGRGGGGSARAREAEAPSGGGATARAEKARKESDESREAGLDRALAPRGSPRGIAVIVSRGTERQLLSSMAKRVAMMAYPGVQILDVVGPLEVFSRTSRWLREHGGYTRDAYSVEILGLSLARHLPARRRAFASTRTTPSSTLLAASTPSFVAGGVGATRYRSDARVLGWLRRQAKSVRRLASVCTGAFFLAEAGLLGRTPGDDALGVGRRVRSKPTPTCAWRPDRLFVREGSIYTSAGVTAGMDSSLALVEEDHGREAALAVARALVMFLKRPGGQAQFSAQLADQIASRETLRDLQAYILDHPQADLGVEVLARRAGNEPAELRARLHARRGHDTRPVRERRPGGDRATLARRVVARPRGDLPLLGSGEHGVDEAGVPARRRCVAAGVPGAIQHEARLQGREEEGGMNGLARAGWSVALSIALAGALADCAPARAPTVATAKRYACPPCDGGCDGKSFDHPGSCPICGMPLVEQGSDAAEAPKGKPVAILVFDGVEIIDFTGPWEVFGGAGFDVYTVAATREPVVTAMGMKLLPRYTFADAPQPAVLLVPGGGVKGARSSAATLALGATSERAGKEHTLSVCNGGVHLGERGAPRRTLGHDDRPPDGPFRRRLPQDEARPRSKVRRQREDRHRRGPCSAGIDGAPPRPLSTMLGKGVAQSTALNLEYDWRPEGGFVRGTLPDLLVPRVNLDAVGKWAFDETSGTRDAWQMVVRGTSAKSAAELHEYIAGELAKGHWRRGAVTEDALERLALRGTHAAKGA